MKYEPLKTQATLRAIDAVAWDGLGEYLVIRSQAGHVGALKAFDLALTPETASDLHYLLELALAEKDNAALPRQ